MAMSTPPTRSSSRLPRFSILYSALGLFAACSAGCGGGGGDLDSAEYSVDGPMDTARTGHVTLIRRGGTELAFGWEASPLVDAPETRGFVTFRIDDVPADATIDSATLTLPVRTVVGDPLTVPWDPIVESVDLGASLDEGDFSGPGQYEFQAPLARQLMTSATSQQFVDVSTAVRRDRAAGRSASSFRINWSLLKDQFPGQKPNGVLVSCGPAPAGGPTIDIKPTITIKWHK